MSGLSLHSSVGWAKDTVNKWRGLLFMEGAGLWLWEMRGVGAMGASSVAPGCFGNGINFRKQCGAPFPLP